MARNRRTLPACIGLALSLCAASAPAATIFLDASTNVVQLDENTSGTNNCVLLAQNPGPGVTVQASGNASFGSNPGEVYNAAVMGYIDTAGLLQYASLPMNGPAVPVNGTAYYYALLTDNQGAHIGNTGTTTITQMAMSTVVGGGTIVAGSTTAAQTGVAQISGLNAAFFNTSPIGVPQYFTVSVSGDAEYAPGLKYGSIIVQYRDATNGITYDSLPIGTWRDYFGFNFRVYITDFIGQAGDNSGTLTVNHSLFVPEPAAAGETVMLLAAGRGLVRRRRQ